MSLLDLIPHQEAIAAHRPWPRVLVGEQGWLKAIDLSTLDAGNFNPVESGTLVPPA